MITNFLDQQHIAYSLLRHTTAYTAAETAENCHISGDCMAKVVIVKLDGKLAMVVEPAHQKVNLKLLEELTHAHKVELASEYEFQEKFPDCEVGAMPPLGNLYNMDVYISPALTKNEQIIFNAGNHSELIKMSYSDFERLVHPHILKH